MYYPTGDMPLDISENTAMNKGFEITYKRGPDRLVYKTKAKNKTSALSKWNQAVNTDWATKCRFLYIKQSDDAQTEMFHNAPLVMKKDSVTIMMNTGERCRDCGCYLGEPEGGARRCDECKEG